jgi:hypothetical protein
MSTESGKETQVAGGVQLSFGAGTEKVSSFSRPHGSVSSHQDRGGAWDRVEMNSKSMGSIHLDER